MRQFPRPIRQFRVIPQCLQHFIFTQRLLRFSRHWLSPRTSSPASPAFSSNRRKCFGAQDRGTFQVLRVLRAQGTSGDHIDLIRFRGSAATWELSMRRDRWLVFRRSRGQDDGRLIPYGLDPFGAFQLSCYRSGCSSRTFHAASAVTLVNHATRRSPQPRQQPTLPPSNS